MGGDELVDVVDDDDRTVGTARLRECLEKGILHRAAAVIVSRSDEKVVLQRRSRHDLWHPGLWTLSSTGHVKSGESYRDGAQRELKEELGLTSAVSEVGRFLLPPMTDGGLKEREWVGLFETVTDEECKIDPVELDSVAEFPMKDLSKVGERVSLTPDASILLKEYLSRRP
jgi:isopentenyl-diphosphate Delta-isomerase